MPASKEQYQQAFELAQQRGDTEQAKFFAQQLVDMGNRPTDWMIDYDPTQEMGTGERFLAGVGKGMSDLAYGAGQMFGLVDQEEVKRKKEVDAPLSATTAGTVGEVAGKVAAAIPAAFVPGANTVAGAGLIGAGLGALEPVAEGDLLSGKAKNIALGGALGAAGQKAGQVIGSKASDYLSSALDRVRGATRVQDIAREGMELGLTPNPSQAKPSVANQILEGLSGKIKTQQAAALKNQPVFNAIARRELGLDDAAELVPETFDMVRRNAGKSYDALKQRQGNIVADDQYFDDLIASISDESELAAEFGVFENKKLTELVDSISKNDFSTKNAVELTKRLRADSRKLFSSLAGNPEDIAMARAKKKAATAVENLIERNLEASGEIDLLNNFRNARQLYAKVNNIESIVNPSSGNVIGSKLGKQIDKGVPLSPEMRKAADFARTFDRASQEVRSSMPMVSPLDYVTGGGLAVGTGNPAALALPLLRPAARSALLSKPYHAAMVKPDIRPSLAAQGMGLLGSPRTSMATGLLAPSIYTAQQ